MNKKLIVCALFGLSGVGLCAMEAKIPYNPTKGERIEALRSFMEDHNDVFDPEVALPVLSDEQLKRLTEREKDLLGMRDEALHRFQEIRDMNPEDVSYSNLEQANQWAEWAMNAAKLDGDVITVSRLNERMKGLLVQGPQPFKRGHRRTPSQAMPVEVQTKSKPLTTKELLDKLAPQKDDVAKTADFARLRKASPVVTSQKAFDTWMKVHGLVVFARASRYKGGKPGPEELPEQELPEE